MKAGGVNATLLHTSLVLAVLLIVTDKTSAIEDQHYEHEPGPKR